MNSYKTLGVSINSSMDEIKKAYKELARKHHPDVGGDESKFKEINSAYQDLVANHDKYKFAYTSQQTKPRSSPWDEADSTWNETFKHSRGRGGSMFDDMLGNLFEHFVKKEHQQRQQQQKSANVMTYFKMNLDDTLKSTSHKLSFRDGMYQDYSVDVTFPPGLSDGDRLRVQGKSPTNHDSSNPGDLIIEIVIIKPPGIKIDDDRNIVKTIDVDAVTAMIGGKIEVKGIDNKRFLVNIPAGSQDSHTLRIPGEGLIKEPRGTERADMLLNIKIIIPSLTQEQKDTLKQVFEK